MPIIKANEALSQQDPKGDCGDSFLMTPTWYNSMVINCIFLLIVLLIS